MDELRIKQIKDIFTENGITLTETIEFFGLMLATEASEKWGYRSRYVIDMYKKYPNKFQEGSIVKIGKYFFISREGMEFLTGKTENEVREVQWRVYIEQNYNIVEEKICYTEENAKKIVKELVLDKMPGEKRDFELSFLDSQKKKIGTLLPGGISVYYKKTKGLL